MTTTAGLALNATTGLGKVFSYEGVISNQAVAANPRAKEEFPWLRRSGTEPTRSKAAGVKSKSVLELVKENSALAASPQMKELYPELRVDAEKSTEVGPLK